MSEPHTARTRGMAAAASTQHTVMPTPPTIIPTVARRAVSASFVTSVMRRLATATDGADENSPENALGDTTSPMSANTTTSNPPATPRAARTSTSCTACSMPECAEGYAQTSWSTSSVAIDARTGSGAGGEHGVHHRSGAPVPERGVVAGADERPSGAAGVTPLNRDARRERARAGVGHPVLPLGLRASAHHQEITGARRKVVDRPLAVRMVVTAGARPQQPRSTRTEGQDGDHRVVEPTHVGIAVEGLAVASVAVLDHPEALELDPVPVLQRAGGVGQRRMGERRSPAPDGSETPLFDEMVVAEQAVRSPRHLIPKVLEELVGARQPAAGDVDPCTRAEFQPFEGNRSIDLDRGGHASSMPLDGAAADGVRVDRWLWSIRLFRSRAEATTACRAGHVRVDR